MDCFKQVEICRRHNSELKAVSEQLLSESDRLNKRLLERKLQSCIAAYEFRWHEGIPGHHLQFATAEKLTNLPTFRRNAWYVASHEGWGLYAERLGKEMGFYRSDASEFGRLSLELWRACRLVVDTGIHAKKWTREQAMKYLQENSQGGEGDIRVSIDHYISWPGQATGYMIGMLKMVELRKAAEKEKLFLSLDRRMTTTLI